MKLIKTLTTTLTIAAVTALSSVVLADAAKGHDHHGKPDPAKSTPVAVDAEMTNAEVRKIDKDSKKITLKHEAIKSLDMPGMTMVFQVKDAALLDKAQAGDKIKFKAVSEGGSYIVTDIQPNK